MFPSESRKQVRIPAGQSQGAVMARTYVLENKGLNWSGHTWVRMATEDSGAGRKSSGQPKAKNQGRDHVC